MASRKRKYASIEEIEEAHQSPDEEESAGDRKRRKNRLNSDLYRFRQRSAQVDGNERVGGNVQVRGSNGPPRSLIEQLLSSEVAPPAETAPVRVRETLHDPSADNVEQQAIAGPDKLQRQRRKRQAEQAQRRRAAMSASQQKQTERQRARRAQQSERDRDRTEQESAEQVKHRKNAKEYESAIVFGTSDDWKKKPKKKRKRAKSAIAFFSCRTAPGCHRKNVKRGDGKIVFVIKKVEP
ncbi:hypothetical protein PC119_g15903 [Phytophthora cactorum]|uniref:Uncharacterized protein n=1 Tax=Phytophthora cactorum TaxID=29920 RepID=A0A8T0YPY1_9STRA|nr:hypothetical protein PC113_g14783 [Phytophthora cactorum]KAG2924129.1 hypothetical protein PC117_g15466 [Phytophthora cactorum]KAG2924139.1 hypothetical protein PC117_g15455 [Phytophthora cactorum]KAG3003616.1 hypothetical protein PC119_g15903 [Phytophthora cactorum]